MKTTHWKVLLSALLVLSSLVAVSIALAAPDTSGGWRLPFNGTYWISDGPSEGLHTVRSAEAIDYASGGVSFEAVAPASGTVLDVLYVDDFGCVIRINHNGLYGFFAHVGDEDHVPNCTDSPRIFVRAGNNVAQGQRIAMTGNTGDGGEANHLHFEARTGAVAGNPYSGWSAPTRGNPGNWWNPWYSPPPDFRHDVNRKSGGAQYPEVRVQPNAIPTPGSGRHLSSQQSPPNGPAGHMSNITDAEATIHLAGSPDTPNSGYETWFQLYQLLYSCGLCWVAPPGGWTTAPTFTQAQGPDNQSEVNGQHTYMVYDWTQNNGWSTFPRYYDFLTGKSAQRIPHAVGNYRLGADTTVLEYCTPTAVAYAVYEFHGVSPERAYIGTDCRILVHRIIGSPNLYNIAVQYPDGAWVWSDWLIVHFW